MSGIKSLADELRDSIRNGPPKTETGPAKPIRKGSTGSPKKDPVAPDRLFENILSFKLQGKEKLLIRLDDKTVFLLKQLKVAKGIDMNKVIAYSLHIFLKNHPELTRYIKEHIKTLDL